MSIFTGKNGYSSDAMWRERSDVALLKKNGLYEYEAGTNDGPDAAIAWLRHKLGNLKQKPFVLEIGSGFGGWAVKLEGLYETYLGAEPQYERFIHSLRLRGGLPNVSFCHIPNGEWDLSQCFDVVLLVTVL